jgi:hypothetical protein
LGMTNTFRCFFADPPLPDPPEPPFDDPPHAAMATQATAAVVTKDAR